MMIQTGMVETSVLFNYHSFGCLMSAQGLLRNGCTVSTHIHARWIDIFLSFSSSIWFFGSCGLFSMAFCACKSIVRVA